MQCMKAVSAARKEKALYKNMQKARTQQQNTM